MLAKYSIDSSKLDVIELEKRPDCSEIQAYLKEITGASSVPRVFVSGKCIGGKFYLSCPDLSSNSIFCQGGDDTAALDAAGKLRDMLASSGAIQ